MGKKQDKPKILHFRNDYSCYKWTFELGETYCLKRWRKNRQTGEWYEVHQMVKFIKVTTKGFNLLDLKTNKCIFAKTKLYDRRLVGKDVPPHWTTFTVHVPAYLPIPIHVETNGEKGG